MMIFQYPLTYRLTKSLFLASVLLIDLVLFAVAILSLATILTDYSLPENIIVSTEMSGVIINCLAICLMTAGVLFVQLMLPAIRVTSDGFQISTFFYRSRLLNWQDIESVREHWLSSGRRRIIAVATPEISPVYSLVGLVQLVGTRSFLVADNISGYEQLIEILRAKRPELSLLTGAPRPENH